jgi:fucose permease
VIFLGLKSCLRLKMRSPQSHPAWIGIALAFYAFIAIGITEGGLGVLLPSIQATYQLNTATVTPLFLSQVTGYVIAALSSSLLSQRLGLARMLLLASVILTTALCFYALSPFWVVMVLIGTLLGLGIGLIDAGINTYIADDQRNAHLMGMLHAFYGMGALMGPTIATMVLASGLSWRVVYFVLAGLVGLVVIGTLWVVVSRYQPMTRKVSISDHHSDMSLSKAFKIPTVLAAGLLLLIYVGMETSMSDWSYSVQVLNRGTPVVWAGYSVSAYWLGLTLGRLGMGQMVSRFGAIRTLNFSLILLIIGAVVWCLSPQPLLSLPIIGFALGPIFPTTLWLMPQRVNAAIVPMAIGLVTSTGSIGAATIPTAIGWIAEQTGLSVIPPLMLLLVAAMIGLHRWLVQHAPTQTQPPIQTQHRSAK